LIKKKLVEMKANSESLEPILRGHQKGEGLITLRLIVITGHHNKSKADQIFLQLARQIMAKVSLAFLLVRNVERIIMVLAGELLVHVSIVGALIIK